MRVGEFKRQLEEAINGAGLTDDDEVILDTEDGNYGVASVQAEARAPDYLGRRSRGRVTGQLLTQYHPSTTSKTDR